MELRLLEYAKEAEDVAADIHAFLADIGHSRKEANMINSDLLAISNALHELHEALQHDLYMRFSSRISRHLEVCLPSLEYTLYDMRSIHSKWQRSSRKDRDGSDVSAPVTLLWEDTLVALKAQGISLLDRLELYRKYLEGSFDILRGEEDEELQSIRVRMSKLLKKQQPIESYFSKLSTGEGSVGDFSDLSLSKTNRRGSQTRTYVSYPSFPPSLPPPSAPEVPPASQFTDSAYGSAASAGNSGSGEGFTHWAMKIFDGRHSSTPFQALGDTTICYGRDVPRVIELLDNDGFEKVVELPFEATNVWVRLYWRSEDSRARIVYLTLSPNGDRLRYCTPLTALILRRSNSVLNLCRTNRKDEQLELWASLRFTMYERLVLFYCTAVAMKHQDQGAVPTDRTELFGSDEREWFISETTDTKYLHTFRLLQDKDSGCIRLEATPRRGPLRTIPIWTAFVTNHVGQRNWIKRVGKSTIQFREIHAYIFCDTYELPTGPTGRKQITFANPEDAKHFANIFHGLKTAFTPQEIDRPITKQMSLNPGNPLGNPSTRSSVSHLQVEEQKLLTEAPYESENEHNSKAASIMEISQESAVEVVIPDSEDHARANQSSTLSELPDAISDDLGFHEVFGSGPVWTCTPSKDTPIEAIPLRISGHPVVIPVESTYPASAFTVPPPDPHPHFIDSSSEIDADTVKHIFQCFESATGFYLLINGMLQLIVPDDFDIEYALSHKPVEFGGLRISYIEEYLVPTAERRGGVSLTSTENDSNIDDPDILQRHRARSSRADTPRVQLNLAGGGTTSVKSTPGRDTSMELKIGSMVQAVAKKTKTTERFQGKIGVMTESNHQSYLVVPSHIFTQALVAAKSEHFPGEMWKDHVTAIASNGGREIGHVAETFDSHAHVFPHGFQCDVSLVEVTSKASDLLGSMRSPIPIDWLSQASWSNIKYNSQNLFLLDRPNLQTKSIGILVSQCQMVGQAIFKVRGQSEKRRRFRFPFQHKRSDSDSEIEVWTGTVSRSVLYRINSAALAPGALSGVAVCVRETAEDNSQCAKVAGFSSWAQPVTTENRFDMEGQKFYNRLQEGRVAFYGAFQAPSKLRDEHRII